MSTSEGYTKNFPVSWQELHRDSKALAWRLVEGGPWTGVIGVARGGLVPATVIARELDLRMVDTACVSSYEHKTRSDVEILKSPPGDGDGWLVIDDLVDTGGTFRALREIIPKAHFATVYAKPAGRPMVDSYVTEVSQDTWIQFPWDTEPQFATPIAGQR
ncbi:MAG: xanthine phosphoribosyltransferase [Alphaproteobacteria bacterium]|nr:xanthine phosphoribosyltransferase [Alphaproteobacteria bacterium]